MLCMRKYKSLTHHMPELMLEWHNKNTLDPAKLAPFSSKKVWWKCLKGHEWKARVASRSSGSGCPYCANKRVCLDNCLATKYPDIAAEWHPEKNHKSPYDVLPCSKLKVWWKCNEGHEWLANLSDRVLAGSGCHVCTGFVKYKRATYTETGKICNVCKVDKPLDKFRTRVHKGKANGRGKGKYLNHICRGCEAEKTAHYRRSTEEGVAAEMVRRKRYEAKSKNIAFDLTKEWVLNKLRKINWKCELTRLPMRCIKDEESYSGFNWDSPSIDRIIPGGPYTKDNVRFVLNQVNIFRQNGSDEQMYKIARALLDNK